MTGSEEVDLLNMKVVEEYAVITADV